MNASIGRPAPEFRAPAYQHGAIGEFALSDRRGRWVVLVFYPLDFTFVCPTELRAFAAAQADFAACGAEVVAVSVDSVYTHQAWLERDLPEIRYPVVSDLTKAIARRYGVLDEAAGAARRATFLIDPQGIVQYMVVAGANTGRSTAETLRVLQAVQTGDLCPANWQPGEQTLGAAA